MSVFGRGRDVGGGLATGRSPALRALGPVLPGSYGGRTAALRTRSLPRRLFAEDSQLRHTDWVLVLAVLALSLMGTLLVWSATRPGLAQAGLNPNSYLEKQLLNVAIGLLLLVAVSLADYRMLKVIAPYAYAVSCLGLLAVLSPLGSTINGAHAWISLPGGFQVEPSEFVKLGLVLVLAVILAQVRGRPEPPKLRQLGLAVFVAVPAIALVEAEPALGVAIVLVAVLAGMIVLSGLRLGWIVVLTTAAALGVGAVFKMHLLQSYQTQRLTSFLNPNANTLGAGYSANQAKIMIGSGGMFGQGLFHGQLVAGNFVPNQQTDFIFTVAGEELGFVGAVAIIAVLGVVLVRALRIAARADDMFGLLVASGIALWFGVQTFVNIGMTIGIAPVTGIPLPFLSYGGSAMFADMMAIGVLQSVHRRHRMFG
ncbi:MAG TPA: rod shape-determining protein RodA [Streptosporangiaceae bacterium]|nr:rod shape-determining protein RodA [Streptosporangiaceae bacterium]